MNREIKFRAFHKPSKQMFEVFSFCDSFVKVYTDKDVCIDVKKCPRIDFEPLLQYTGLKDKKGKEMYENQGVNVASKFAGIIQYSNGGFVIENSEGRQIPIGELISYLSYEVTSDIFQNPELLNQ